MQEFDPSAVAAAFGLGTPSGDPEPVAGGAMGFLWRLKTDTGTWAVKQLFEAATDADTEVESAFVDAARAAGVRAPRVIRATSGEVVHEDIRVYEWIENAGAPAAPAHSFEAGSALATLHALEVPATGPPDEWYMRRHIGDAATLAAVVPEFDVLDDLAGRSPAGPWQVCHRDFDPGNTLVDAKGNLVFVDWDNAGALTAESELAYSLLAWTSTRDFLEGYRSVRPIPEPRGLEAFSVGLAGRLNFVALMSNDPRGRTVIENMPTMATLERVLDDWRSSR